MADVDEAIEVTREGLNVIPPGDSAQFDFMINLGARLSMRFQRVGSMIDLEEAIHLTQQAVDMTPPAHPHRALRLQSMGDLFCLRYQRSVMTADLDKAIAASQQAIAGTPSDHPERARRLNSLGNTLRIRYLRTGALSDLEEAIRVTREATNSVPSDHPHRPGLYNNLGNYLRDKFERTDKIGDLEEAIVFGRKAVSTISPGHEDQRIFWSNLGTLLRTRYQKTGHLVDLDESIEVGREAVKATPKDHSERMRPLVNLSAHLLNRFSRTGTMSDLEEAIQVAKEGIDATPQGHSERAEVLINLGDCLAVKYRTTKSIEDLAWAVSHYQEALQNDSSPTTSRVGAGIKALAYVGSIANWQRAYEISEVVVGLVPKLAIRSLNNMDKQHLLGQIAGLASDAAATAFHAGKGPLSALGFLELGRGVIATSLEEIRTDDRDLLDQHPVLAEKFARLQEELEITVHGATDGNDRETLWQTQSQRRYEKGQELDQLIADIREMPGFEDFLRPPSEDAMRDAARCGPIAIVNVSRFRCDAILVDQDQIRSVHLSRLTSDEIEQRALGGNLGSLEILEWLWDVIARPILDTLGFTGPPSSNDWPRIWWIPTGPLSKFPLHAAGHHLNTSHTVLDRVMSSYSSSVKTLIHGRRRPVTPVIPTYPPGSQLSAEAVLVAMEHTPQSSWLPFATKEVEILRQMCHSMKLNPVEPRRQKQDILAHLTKCKIFHFAGHGHTDTNDPSKSYLLLEDGRENALTVADLLEMNLRKHSPYLAYLSACGTGRIDNTKFVDESIHLISGCQLAGFRHVIGTLWEVSDELCVDMARITYEGLRDGGMTDESVCLGLHKASRQLRDQWLAARARIKDGNRLLERKVEQDRGSQNVAERDTRDVILDDDKEEVGWAHWVPYVHFGV